MAVRNSTEHMILGPSKEHQHTNVEFCGKEIQIKNEKKFLIYDLQPTWESAFQHRKIEEQVQHAHEKNTQKNSPLCTRTDKTHVPRRSPEAAKDPSARELLAMTFSADYVT